MISSLTRRTKDDIVSAMKKTNRLKKRRILTVKEFRARFGDDDQCARYLASERWPNGFRCPRCGGRRRRWRSPWNVVLPERKGRNPSLGLRLWPLSRTRRPAAGTDFCKPKSNPAVGC